MDVTTCPVCQTKTIGGVCQRHGAVCENCGALYGEAFCPYCYQLDEASSDSNSRRLKPNAYHLGELGIGPREFGVITGRASVSRKESNILRAASDEEPSRRKIRLKAEAAVRWLGLPRNKEVEIVETVERNAFFLSKLWRAEGKAAGRKIHASLVKAVEYSLLSEARRIGRTIREVQDALARAGFNMRLQLFTLKIAVPSGGDISSVSMFVNGWRRDQRDYRPREAGEGTIGKEYSVHIHALLSDAIDQTGRVGNQSWIEVRFENAIILPDESAVSIGKREKGARGGKWYSTTTVQGGIGKNALKYDQRNPHTVRLKLNTEDCFTLFKDVNRLLVEDASRKIYASANFDSSSSEVESIERQHLSLPSKEFPASASLLRRACCLATLEKRSVELFREFLRNSEGQSIRALARKALFEADCEVYNSLPRSVKLAVKGYVSTLPLKRRDRSYTGVKGLLIPSEALER